MRLSTVLLGLLVLTLGCVDINNIPAPTATSPPPSPLSLAGTWSHTASFSNQAIKSLCTSTGTLSLSQSDSTITGGYDVISVCTDSTGSTTSQSTGTLGGHIAGSAVSLSTDSGCSYRGTVADTTAGFAAGDGTCNFVINGLPHTFFGTWQAAKSSACGVPGIVMRRESEALCSGQ
jgi:hypothetical protein